MKDDPALTKSETNRLIGLERIVARTKAGFLECGEALMEIRDKRLYRETHGTFEAYCEEKWNLKRRRAYQLMEAATSDNFVQNFAHSDKKVNESQARALAGVPEAEREAVIEAAQADGKPLTAASIKAAAKAAKPEPQPVDGTGMVIPESLRAEWQRADDWREWLQQISRLKCAVEKALAANDAVTSEISNILVANISNVYGDLKCLVPYAVCWTCVGHKPERCQVCGKRGFVSRFRYETLCPEEIREMRKTAGAAHGRGV